LNENIIKKFSFKTFITIIIFFSIIIGLLLGYLLISSYQSQILKDKTVLNRYNEVFDELNLLVAQNQELITHNETLEEEVSKLKTTYTANKLAEDNIKNYELLLGKRDALGPGIFININLNLASYWLVDILNELFTLGAEAVEINNIRIVPSTSIQQDLEDNQILINNTKIISPYEIKILGNPNILYKGISNNTSVLKKLEQSFPSSKNQIKIEISDKIILKAFYNKS